MAARQMGYARGLGPVRAAEGEVDRHAVRVAEMDPLAVADDRVGPDDS